MGLRVLAGVSGLFLMAAVFWDAYTTVFRSMRGPKHTRFARILVRFCWQSSVEALRRSGNVKRRECLQFFGPLSFVLTLAPWAAALILAFALLQWALGAEVAAPERVPTFGTILYMSGVTFFTLGFGDVVPLTPLARLLAVVEAGTGFAFIALILSYVPLSYQAIHRRESPLVQLDAQAGSPPTATEFLRRLGQDADLPAAGSFFQQWDAWVADIMQSHLSYPIIAYSRSESESRTWLAALTMLLDASTLVTVGIVGAPVRPARLTFIVALECVTGLCEALGISPRLPPFNRLPPAELDRLRAVLKDAGAPLREGDPADEELARQRGLYEPCLTALGDHLLMTLPPWILPRAATDDTNASDGV